MGTTSIRTMAGIGILGLAVMIGACTRSASTAPTQTPAGGESSSAQTGQQATMEAVRSALLTQTAQAAQGAGGATATATPGSGVVTATAGGAAASTTGTPAAPATPAGSPVPVPTYPVPASYTLHEGEFPYCLGRRFNRNPDDILAVNGLTSGSYTYPGQTLQIPTTGTFLGQRSLLQHPTNYVVQGGQTIYSIACNYGDVWPEAIAEVNGLSAPYTLTVGSTIRIP